MRIIVYSNETCPYSKLTRDFFVSKGYKIEVKNVSQDSKAAEEAVRLSGQMGVPVTEISREKDRHVIVGWNKDMLEESLAHFRK